jgi:hypothetical protein
MGYAARVLTAEGTTHCALCCQWAVRQPPCPPLWTTHREGEGARGIAGQEGVGSSSLHGPTRSGRTPTILCTDRPCCHTHT